MNIYTKMLEFFMENGVVLNKEQMLGLHDLCETIADDQKLDVLQEAEKRPEKPFLDAYNLAVQHMLKYQYNQKAQSSSWVGTIRQQTGFMQNMYEKKSLWHKISNRLTDEMLDEEYKKAVKKTIADGNNCDFPKNIPEKLSKESLLDKNNVEQFLQDYKYTDSVKRVLDADKDSRNNKRK